MSYRFTKLCVIISSEQRNIMHWLIIDVNDDITCRIDILYLYSQLKVKSIKIIERKL